MNDMLSMNGYGQILNGPRREVDPVRRGPKAKLNPEKRRMVVDHLRVELLKGKNVKDLYPELLGKGLLEFDNRLGCMTKNGFYTLVSRMKEELGVKGKRRIQIEQFKEMNSTGIRRSLIMKKLNLSLGQYAYLHKRFGKSLKEINE